MISQDLILRNEREYRNEEPRFNCAAFGGESEGKSLMIEIYWQQIGRRQSHRCHVVYRGNGFFSSNCVDINRWNRAVHASIVSNF